MKFHIITIFPEVLEEYFNSSVLGRALKAGVIKIKLHDLRKYATGKHKKVDDRPYGGGPGMVLKIEPIAKAILKIKLVLPARFTKTPARRAGRYKVIVFSPSGKQFTQKMARNWAKKYDDIVMICGRYEGIDARVKKIFSAEEISVGPYILTGGELPAAVVADAVSRQIPGVLGKEESLEEERGTSGFPVYTRPDIFEFKGVKYSVPKVLKSGDHEKVKKWREKNSKNN